MLDIEDNKIRYYILSHYGSGQAFKNKTLAKRFNMSESRIQLIIGTMVMMGEIEVCHIRKKYKTYAIRESTSNEIAILMLCSLFGDYRFQSITREQFLEQSKPIIEAIKHYKPNNMDKEDYLLTIDLIQNEIDMAIDRRNDAVERMALRHLYKLYKREILEDNRQGEHDG